MLFKKICFAAVFVLMAFSAVSCGSGREEEINSILTMEIHFMNYILNNQIAAFKAAYPDVTLVINDYSHKSNEDYNTMLQTALMGGSTSDLIFFYPENIYQGGTSPYIMDLNEFIASDETFNEADYFMNHLKAFEINGKLCAATGAVTLHWMAVNRGFMERAEVDYSRYQGFSCSDTIALFKSIDEAKRDGYYLAPGLNAYWLIWASSDYYDPVNKTANFNTSAFINTVYDIAEFKYPGGAYYDMPSTFYTWTAPQDRYAFFAFFDLQPRHFLPNEGPYLFMKGEVEQYFDFRPFMINDNEVFGISPGISINANGQNKELAWEFIKFILSGQYEVSSGGLQCYTNRAVLEKEIDRRLLACFVEYMDTPPTEEEQAVLFNTKELIMDYAAMPIRFPMTYKIPEIDNAFADFEKGIITAEQMAADFQNKAELLFKE